MDRLRDKILCNPTVKLTKGEIYPSIGIDKITSGYKYVSNVDSEPYSGQSCSKFCKGDTIMARITPCLENGKIAQYNLDSELAMGSTEFFVFRGIKDVSDNDYIYYLTSTDYVRNSAVNSMTGASGRQRADIKFIGKLKWDFPEYDIQCQIGKILSNYDDLIEENNRKIEILQEMAGELYKEWFVRFRFPGYKNTKIENGLPMGWKTKKYAEEINIKYGKGLPTERLLAEGYPVFGSNGIIGYYSKYMYEKPQILISCRGASSGVVNISLPNSFVTSNSLVCEMCETLTESTFEYLKYYFLNTNLVQYQTGSAQPQITIDNIKKLKIVIPPRNIQEKFSSMVIPIDQDLLLLKNQNKNLKQQRDLLLPRLMSGKLEVKGDAHA